MNEDRRRGMRAQHARFEYHCSCGAVVRGNGGRFQHRLAHERRGDGHHFITRAAFIQRSKGSTP